VQPDRIPEEFPLGETRMGHISTKGGKVFFLSYPSRQVMCFFAQLVDCGAAAMRAFSWEPTIEIRDPNGTLISTQSETSRLPAQKWSD